MSIYPPEQTFRSDPVLRLLPEEVPFWFSTAEPPEQAWRGRLYLIMYGAGYEPEHAWWFAGSNEADWVRDMKAQVARVPDTEYAKMVAGRIRFDNELARQAEVGEQ